MKNPFEAMPSPFELANKGKSATVTMSLRIKQTTKDFFDKQAKMIADGEEAESNKEDKDKSGKTSASSLINTLLDWYAESYTQQVAKTPISTVLRPYLVKMAEKSAAMDDESLIYRAFRPGRKMIAELLPTIGYDSVADVVTDYKNTVDKYDRGIKTDYYPDYPVQIGTCCLEIFCEKEIASGNSAEYYFELDLGDERETHLMRVVPEKWPIVAAMTDNYIRKIEELTGENDDDFHFSTEKFKEMTDIVNSAEDKKELAEKLARFFADYAEQVYE